MNFKTVVAPAVMALSLFSAPAEAFERSDCEILRNDSMLCITHLGNAGGLSEWKVGYQSPDRTINEAFRIVCEGKRVYDWSSHGNMTQEDADDFAALFCRA